MSYVLQEPYLSGTKLFGRDTTVCLSRCRQLQRKRRQLLGREVQSMCGILSSRTGWLRHSPQWACLSALKCDSAGSEREQPQVMREAVIIAAPVISSLGLITYVTAIGVEHGCTLRMFILTIPFTRVACTLGSSHPSHHFPCCRDYRVGSPHDKSVTLPSPGGGENGQSQHRQHAAG